jgi:hypothetical protein
MPTRHITIQLDCQLDSTDWPLLTVAEARSAAVNAITQVAMKATEQGLINAFRLEPSHTPIAIRHTVDCQRCRRRFACVGTFDDPDRVSEQGDGCASWVVVDKGRFAIAAYYGSSFDMDVWIFAEEPPEPRVGSRLCDDCVQTLIDDRILVPAGSVP